MDLRPCALSDVAPLFARYHGYKSVGNLATYCHAVVEDGQPVAAFVWNPPPPGACAALSAAPAAQAYSPSLGWSPSPKTSGGSRRSASPSGGSCALTSSTGGGGPCS